MADNIDPQQIDDLNKNLSDLISAISKASGTSTTGSAGAGSAGAVGGLGELLGMSKKTAGILDALGSSAGGLTKALYQGEKGAQVFSNAIEALSVAIMLIPGLGAAAKIASVALYAFSKSLGAVTKQGDALYKTYQDLQKSGATAADGITGVFNNMQRFGYGIEELDKMVQLVAQNSETLAKFSLTAADGTNAFSTAMQDLVRDQGLKELGKMPDQINSAGAAFIRQSVRAGISQRDIGDQLGAQTKRYIMDLDRLQRLTGISADQLQKQQDEAMAKDAYNDVMSELKQRALAGDTVAQAQIDKITTVMAKLGPELRKEFILSIGGDISAGQRLFMGAPSLLMNVMDESASLQKTLDDVNRDAINTVGAFGKTARLAAGSVRETIGPLYEYRELISSTANFDERAEAAKRQINVQDKATKNLAAIDLANMNSRDALQSFVQLGVEPATNALRGLANTANGGTGLLPGGVGLGGMGSFGGKLDSLGAGSSANADAAMKFFMSAGWSKEQAAGIVGNLQVESGKNLNTRAVGDGGKAKGIAQWHPDRQANFAKVMGKSIEDSTLEEQLKFVDWELKNTEKDAGDKLRQAKTALQAAQLVDSLYERSSGTAISARIASAAALAGPTGGYNSAMGGVQPGTTLPSSTANAPTKDPNRTESDDILDALRGTLVSLDRKMADVADNTKKTATYAGQ
jgi:hypothetical protein